MKKLKVAVITTVYFPNSHADVIVTRWLRPYPSDARFGWTASRSEIVSMFVAQFPDGSADTPSPDGRPFNPRADISRQIAAQHGVPIFPSIREALTLGGDELTVDAVLLIGEHGDYPYNALGQKLYPRRELFEEIVSVFRESGRVVPLFCDKHLSWSTPLALEMADAVRELEIPLMAGSSLPHHDFIGAWTPPGAPIQDAVSVFNCGPETYGFHSLELMQALAERRDGGESGIAAITAYAGEAVWEAQARGAWDEALLDAAVNACSSCEPGHYRDNLKPNHEESGEMAPESPIAFVLERRDGMRDAHLMLHGHVNDFALALRLRDDPQIHPFDLGASAHPAEEHFPHFAVFDRIIEEFFVTRRSPIPLERTLLTTLAINACMEALQQRGQRLETPQLHIAYQPSPRVLHSVPIV